MKWWLWMGWVNQGMGLAVSLFVLLFSTHDWPFVVMMTTGQLLFLFYVFLIYRVRSTVTYSFDLDDHGHLERRDVIDPVKNPVLKRLPGIISGLGGGILGAILLSRVSNDFVDLIVHGEPHRWDYFVTRTLYLTQVSTNLFLFFTSIPFSKVQQRYLQSKLPVD